MVHKRVEPVARIELVAPDADGLRLRDERSDGDARLLRWERTRRNLTRGGRLSRHGRRSTLSTLVEPEHVLDLRLPGNEFRGRCVLADIRHLANADGLFLVDFLARVVVDDGLAATDLVLLAHFEEVRSVAERQLLVVIVVVHDVHGIVAHENRKRSSLHDVDEHILRRLAVCDDAQGVGLVGLLRPEVVSADRHGRDVLGLRRTADRARLPALKKLHYLAAHGVSCGDEIGLAAEPFLSGCSIVHVAVKALVLLRLDKFRKQELVDTVEGSAINARLVRDLVEDKPLRSGGGGGKRSSGKRGQGGN